MVNDEQRITKIIQSYREVNHAMYHVLLKIAQQHGITPLQLLVLNILQGNPQIGLTELAEKLKTGTSTASGVIDRMERAGLVTRTRCGADRRALNLALTEKGSQQWAEIHATRLEMFQPLLELSEEDQAEFIRIQQQILHILRKIRED